MKQHKSILVVLLLIISLLVISASCGAQKEEQPDPAPPDDSEAVQETEAENEGFSYSRGIDDNGFWEGIRALDYVEMFEYEGIVIPKEVHDISDEDVQSAINSMLESFSTSEQIKNRAVENGDTVNIDYIGSVGGVEFEGGNTNGGGTDVTIGETNYIDDFLEQLIGRLPGETFNVEVTFPADYGVEELNGKDAVFVTTINYIVEFTRPELTDSFIAENYSAQFGWKSVEEFKDGVYKEMRNSAIREYIQTYLHTDVTVKSVPDFLMVYQEGAMIVYYMNLADSYGVGFEEILGMMGVPDLDTLIEMSYEGNMQWARYSLVSQAIAEDLAIVISNADVADFFKEIYGVDDYSNEEESYGLPYLKQMVMYEYVMNHLIDHAVLGDSITEVPTIEN